VNFVNVLTRRHHAAIGGLLATHPAGIDAQRQALRLHRHRSPALSAPGGGAGGGTGKQ
jgi:hypothetical protein